MRLDTPNKFGPDTEFNCDIFECGENVSIGVEDPEDVRRLGRVNIKAKSIKIGDNVKIGREVVIIGDQVEIQDNCVINNCNKLQVKEFLSIGESGIIHEDCSISGRDVRIGKRLWMLPHAEIGGGSCTEVQSKLQAGDYLHLGMYSFINTARPVTIGNEVGLGTGTKLYTHGAYLSFLDGFPVSYGPITIGNQVWIPGGIVNPGVEIGDNVVIGVNSLVTKDIPSGCLAAGSPAKVIRENCYPRSLSIEELNDVLRDFFTSFVEIIPGLKFEVDDAYYLIHNGSSVAVSTSTPKHIVNTFINLSSKTVSGSSNNLSDRLIDQFRRYGVRLSDQRN
jgi:acetyltransferase-like isoleucine patch superfamily enzyme